MRIIISVLVLCLTLSVFCHAADNAVPTGPNFLPVWMDAAFPTSNTEHLRIDEAGITKYGDGSFDKGLNVLGGGGFHLFGVTNTGDGGNVGWHIFKRPAWNAPVPRPRFEYKRIDTVAVEKLGDGKFDDGMKKVEQDHWELVAFTSDKAGQIGWFYFERPVTAR